MEVSAFAAYQEAAKNVPKNKSPKEKSQQKKSPQEKSPKDKKQKNENNRPEFVLPKAPKVAKKRKPSNPLDAEPVAKSKTTKSVLTASVQNGSTKSTSPKNKKKKVTKPIVTNGRASHQHESPSTSSSDIGLNVSSIEKGREAFKHLLSGVDVKTFMSQNWEKSPLYIDRKDGGHYDHLKVSTEAIDEMLRSNMIEYTKNLDITSYEDSVRETHNPDGRALPASVWAFYRDGCSVRLINPQTFMGSLNKFNAALQEYFHCLVGANIYLTPANSQGFAPHYDDIEAFVLQIEGEKEWLLYPPRNDNETLPRESSGNFSQDEIGEPVFKQILKPGDLLYFPRGWIHQARTVENHHSLHITISVYQKNSYADLLEVLTKQALKSAIESNVAIRKGLPLHLWNHFGQTYADCVTSKDRNIIKEVMTDMFRSLEKHLDMDSAVDKLALKYQHDALPPVLSSAEKVRTTFGTKPILRENGDVEMPEMDENTPVRLVRAHIIRLIYEEDAHLLYYYADNSKEYHGSDLNFIELEKPTVDVVKKLIRFYPKYAKIQDLSGNSEEAMAVVYSLWDRGLLMTESPLV